MNGIELQDREFFAAIREKREPNASVAQVLPCYKVLHQLEQQLASEPSFARRRRIQPRRHIVDSRRSPRMIEGRPHRSMQHTPPRPLQRLRPRPRLHEPEPRLRHAARRARRPRPCCCNALDSGVTLFDTAALYGFGLNETLVGEVLAPHRTKFTLASKGGLHGNAEGKRVVDGRPEIAQGELRAKPEAPAHRGHRPLLPAPLGQARAHRRQRRCDERSGARGQGADHRPL